MARASRTPHLTTSISHPANRTSYISQPAIHPSLSLHIYRILHTTAPWLRNFTYENGTKPAHADATELFGSDPNVEVECRVMFGYDPNDRGLGGTDSDRDYFADGSFVEHRVTFVPRTETFPEGVKYAFQYVAADGMPMLRYDNAHGEHERHAGPEAEGEPIQFAEDVQSHYSRFLADVKAHRRGEHR